MNLFSYYFILIVFIDITWVCEGFRFDDCSALHPFYCWGKNHIVARCVCTNNSFGSGKNLRCVSYSASNIWLLCQNKLSGFLETEFYYVGLRGSLLTWNLLHTSYIYSRKMDQCSMIFFIQILECKWNCPCGKLTFKSLLRTLKRNIV